MLARLAVPYVDASATDLCWALAATGLPPLASVDLEVGAASVRLTILGASHEVVATVGAATCVEAVACGVPGCPLPASASRRVSGLRYRLASEVLHLPPAELSRRTARLHDELGPDRLALVAAFPGEPEALTAVAVWGHGGSIGWRTWHAYPRSGELVATETVVVGP